MSVERYQTILQFGTQGVEQVLADVNRVIQELRKVSGPTAYESLPRGIQQSIAQQEPRTANRMQTLAGQQEAAERTATLTRRLYEEKKKELVAATRNGESEEKIASLATQAERLEIASINAANREATARNRLVSEYEKILAALSQRAARDRQSAASHAQLQRDEERLDRERIAAKRRDSMAVWGGDADRARASRQMLVQEQRDQAAADARRREQMRASATHAFSQVPSSFALNQEELNRLVSTPTRQTGDSDRVFRARQILADAQIARSVAESGYAEQVRRAAAGEGRSKQELIDAVRRATIAHDRASRGVVDAEQRLASAINNQALAHARNARRSMREDFISGFRGRRDASYAEQIGQAMKFSVFYGTAYRLLFGLTQTLQATFQEGVAFQQGMTDLAIATSRPKEELDTIADELGRSAVRAGFAPSQGIEIGARSLGLYGVTDSDQATQDRVMAISSRVVNQLAVGAKKEPVELQGDIAAIAQALGLGASGQFRIADLDAFMTKKFGIQQGSTLETVAQSASVGKAAGFSDEQLFAIAADMISRTGQTPSAVAGYMAQIFSRGGEGSLVDVAKRQGIDPNQELAGIVRELAALYERAEPRAQAEISAAFGRGKIQNAAVALLGDYDEVLMRSGQAGTGAAGQADRQFEMRMNNIGGQVAQLQGVLRDFASQLGESGLLDILGLGIVTFREMMQAINGFLRLWNQLPNAVQDVLIGLGLLTVALRTGAAGAGLNGLLAAGGAGGQFRRTAGGSPVFVNPAGAASPLMSRAGMGGLAAAGRAALGMLGPIGIAIGGLLAIGSLKNSADRMDAAQRAATQALLRPEVGVGSSSADFQAYAGELRSLAKQNQEATGWFAQALTFGQANNDNEDAARRLRAESRRAAQVAERLAAEENRPSGPPPIFKSFSERDLSAGIEGLEASGFTAAQRLERLRDVLYGTADAASVAEGAFDADLFAGQVVTDLMPAVARQLRIRARDIRLRPPGDPTGGGGVMGQVAPMVPLPREEINAAISRELRGPQAQRRLRRGLDEAGVESEADLDPRTVDEIAQLVGAGWAERVLGPYDVDSTVIAETQGAINAAIAETLLRQAKAARDMVTGSSKLTADEAKATVSVIVADSEASLGALQDSDRGGRLSELRSRLGDLRRINRRSGGGVGDVHEQIDAARRALAEAQFEELEDLRRVAMQRAANRREANQIGRGFLESEINNAIRRGSGDVLVQIIKQAGLGAREIAKKAISDALRVARTALEEAQAALAGLPGLGVLLDPIAAEYGPDVFGIQTEEDKAKERAARRAERQARNNAKKIDELRKMERAMRRTPSAAPEANVYSAKGMDVYNPNISDEEEKAEEEKETAAQRAAARAEAYASKTQGGMRAARASIFSARVAIAEAEKNSVEYWNAMGQLWQAQNSLAEAQRAYQNNVRLLSIDMTNPLKEARVAATMARRKLRDDMRAGMDRDVIAQDRVDYRRARANREATAFSQRLQSVQTAEELGRISHSKYINYLENERRRLERIKNRTFQQQEQLNTIDRALKAASDQMQAQWNFGDIKLPTPYQVRRYIEAQSGAREARLATTARSTTVQNNTFQINGADTAMVKKTIEKYVGTATKTRTTQPRRR